MKAWLLATIVLVGCGGDDGSSTGGPHDVQPCDSVGVTGQWEQITPPAVSLDPNFSTPAGMNYGAHSLVVDPHNTANIILGTSAQGMYKSKDCGATWAKLDTGANADAIDGGRQWTFQIDPRNSDVMYVNSGYGHDNAWKSTNGGVDWELLIDPAYAAALQFGGFVHSITMAASAPDHLIVTPHFECEMGQGAGGLPATKACLLSTSDGGATWKILEGTPPAGEGASEWMLDDKTWFWSAYFEGLWITTNAGEAWRQVIPQGTYSTARGVKIGGTYFTGGVFSTLTSTDGETWTAIPNAPGTEVLATDGTHIFGARGAYYGMTTVADPTQWTQLPTPAFHAPDNVSTPTFTYDADHHILYSANLTNGLWRLVVDL